VRFPPCRSLASCVAKARRTHAKPPFAGFVFFCCFAFAFCIYIIVWIAPTHGNKTPLVYVSICSLAGSVSVMAVKGFGVALKLTFAGNNQLWSPGTWVFALTITILIAVQMHYFTKVGSGRTRAVSCLGGLPFREHRRSTSSRQRAIRVISQPLIRLTRSSNRMVNPSYFVGFSSMTLIASIILFHGLNTSGGANTLSLLCGFYIISLGVYLLVSLPFFSIPPNQLTSQPTAEPFARIRSHLEPSQPSTFPAT
jgi:hypothetical protein